MADNNNPVKRSVKKISVAVLVFSLTSSQLAYATLPVYEIERGIQMVGQQILQNRQNQAQMLQQAQIMQSLKPKKSPSKLFPYDCLLPDIQSAFPNVQEACPTQADPQAISQYAAYKDIATENITFFDNMMKGGLRAPRSEGLECLIRKKDDVDKKLDADIQGLELQLGNVQEINDRYKQELINQLEVIKKDNNELFGPQGNEADIDQKTADFSKLFNNECKDIIGIKEINESAANGGLNGLRSGMVEKNNSAGQFLSPGNIAQIEKDIKEEIDKIKQDVDDFGIDGLETNINSYPEYLKQNVATDMNKFTQYYEKIKADFQEAGNPLVFPPLNHNFMRDSQASISAFKADYVESCVQGQQGGIAMSPQDILGSLVQKGSTMRGNTVERYRDELSNYLKVGPTYDELIIKLNSMDLHFGSGNVTIEYRNEQGRLVNQNLNSFYREINSRCKTYYDTNIAPDNKAAIAELKKIRARVRTFKSELSNELSNKIINCKGKQATPGACNPDSLKLEAANFCIPHASACAGKIQGCFTSINSEVDKRKKRIKDNSFIYNNMYASMIDQEKKLLARVKNQVVASMETIKGLFPDANYEIPENFIIKTPTPSMTKFGVLLSGGGELDTFDQVVDKIRELKDTLKRQKEKVLESIERYTEKEQNYMEENIVKWKELKDACITADSAARGIIAGQQQQQQKQYGEAMNFCRRFRDLRANPAPGCNEGDNSPDTLYDEMTDLVGFLTPNISRDVNRLRNFCNQVQNEKDEEFSEEYADGMMKRVCRSADGKSAKALKNIRRKILNSISDDDTREIVERIIELKGESIENLFRRQKENLGAKVNRVIRQYMQLENEVGDKGESNGFCQGDISQGTQTKRTDCFKEKFKEVDARYPADVTTKIVSAENLQNRELEKEDERDACKIKYPDRLTSVSPYDRIFVSIDALEGIGRGMKVGENTSSDCLAGANNQTNVFDFLNDEIDENGFDNITQSNYR